MAELKALEDIAGMENGWLRAKQHFAIGEYGSPAHGPVGAVIHEEQALRSEALLDAEVVFIVRRDKHA